MWLQINTQWRAVSGGVIGLDYTAVSYIAKILNIEINECVFKKIKRLEMYTLKRQAEKGSD